MRWIWRLFRRRPRRRTFRPSTYLLSGPEAPRLAKAWKRFVEEYPDEAARVLRTSTIERVRCRQRGRDLWCATHNLPWGHGEDIEVRAFADRKADSA